MTRRRHDSRSYSQDGVRPIARVLGAAVGITACLAAAPLASGAQGTERVRLSGYIRNGASAEVVRSALLTIDSTAARAESNADGFYFVSFPPGAHRVQVRAIGYAPLDTTVSVEASRQLDLLLTPRPYTLQAVAISAESDRPEVDPKVPAMSVARLDMNTVRLAPAVLGEVDLLKSLTLLPGVSSASDLSTSFNVRGGGADQNLILLDESAIYNPAHILGFLSVFNADAIDDVTLYKGAIPSRFGGRLSSVVDIRQREGNANAFGGSASIGLLASRIVLEGPLPKHAGSFLLAARRSYADVFLKAASNPDLRDNVAYFYDINAKGNFRLGANGTVMASGYVGRDRFRNRDRFGAGWGNGSGTLRWNHVVGGRLFSKALLARSLYDYRLDFQFATDDSVSWTARIASTDFRLDEAWHVGGKGTISFGAQVTALEIRPGDLAPRGTSEVAPKTIETRRGVAPAVYVGHEVELGSRFSVEYGLRWSTFQRRGPATVYIYPGGATVTYNATLARYERGVLVDSTRYAAGAPVRAFGGLEPRVSGRYSLSEASSLKASVARTRQYVQLVSRTNSPTPLDVWEPVGPYLRPEVADQVALGYVSNRRGGAYQFSVEGYFKRVSGAIDFIDGADIVLNNQLETVFLQGDGRAYGLELYLRKGTGTLTGWISYTLSRAEQRMRGTGIGGPGVNRGAFYPASHDKTHHVSVVGVAPWGKRWTLGGTFSLASGVPVTYPESRYYIDGFLIAEYGDRNQSRLPLYHRLDLSATRRWGRGELQLGVFNAYNRFNAQSIRFRQSERNAQEAEAVQLSVFGAVPSVSYSFHF